jgi:hypothetical protein
MDARLRQLERQYASSGSSDDLNKLLRAMLQINSLEEWEVAAETEGSLASHVISHLRDFGKPVEYDYMGDPIKYDSECFVNVYEDFTARTTVLCFLSQVSRIRGWLRDFYTRHQLFYPGWQGGPTEYPEIEDPFDDILGPINYTQLTPTDDPPAKIVINHSNTSCFRLHPNEIVEEAHRRGVDFEVFTDSAIRILSPINRWGQRDYPVSFGIIESYEEAVDIETTTFVLDEGPHWMNVYRTSESYGGPEEGGWWYDTREPMVSIYIGQNLLDDDPKLEEVSSFISELYFGPGIVTVLQAHPALAEPHQRTYYE